jgi:hypothetical protein
MTSPERQKLFQKSIKDLQRSAAFAEAMSHEIVTRATALTLWQLTQESHNVACQLLKECGGDATPNIQ